jgi:hypothetical protein
MVRRARAVCPARACARALSGTVSQTFPRIEQGQLTLLGIEVQQRAHHLLHDLQLIRRVAGVQLSALHPAWIACLPQRYCSLCLGNLLGKADHLRFFSSRASKHTEL